MGQSTFKMTVCFYLDSYNSIDKCRVYVEVNQSYYMFEIIIEQMTKSGSSIVLRNDNKVMTLDFFEDKVSFGLEQDELSFHVKKLRLAPDMNVDSFMSRRDSL